MSKPSRPLGCSGFAATLDTFGYSITDEDELFRLAAEGASGGTRHPVFDLMQIHVSQCPNCVGFSDPTPARRVVNPRPGRVA